MCVCVCVYVYVCRIVYACIIIIISLEGPGAGMRISCMQMEFLTIKINDVGFSQLVHSLASSVLVSKQQLVLLLMIEQVSTVI